MLMQAVRAAAALAAVTLLVEACTGQPAGTPDKVLVRDKKDGTTKSYDGVLKFGPAGLQVTNEKGDKVLASFAPADVVKYTPGDLPGADRADVLAQLTLEDKKTRKDYETARSGYTEMLKKAAKAPDKTRQYLEYKVALMTTRVADESADDEKWAEQAAEAAKVWDAFLAERKTGWELWPAAKTLARLYAELDKFDEAARTWGRVAKTADLPADLRLEAGVQEVDALFRAGKYPNAEAAAAALGKTAPAGPAKDKLAIYELAAGKAAGTDPLAAVKEIEAKIAATKDPGVRAVGFGVTGELYLVAKKPREAMWEFLWVETVYNQDRDEVLKAMTRLVRVYAELMEEDRAKAYREKIRRYRAGL